MRAYSRNSAVALLIASGALIAPAPRVLTAQSAPAVRVTWVPEQPVQGTLFRVRVEPTLAEARLAGRVGGGFGVAFGSGEAEQTLLEDRVALVPQR